MARKPAKKPTKASVTKAADRAVAKSAGEEVTPVDNPVLTPPEVKRKRGRPTKYDPAFCEQVIELGEQGKSRTQIARTLGVVRQTLTDWEASHPEFSDAMSIAEEFSQAWWEDRGQEGISMGKDFNGFVFSFQMKNRFRNQYSDKVEVKHDASAAFTQCWQAIGTGQLEGRR